MSDPLFKPGTVWTLDDGTAVDISGLTKDDAQSKVDAASAKGRPAAPAATDNIIQRALDAAGNYVGKSSQMPLGTAGIGASLLHTVAHPIDNAPMVGGTIGGALGGGTGTAFGLGLGGIPGITAGAALGGSAGEAIKQLYNRAAGAAAPDTSEEAARAIGKEGLTQGAYGMAGGVADVAAPWLGERLVKKALAAPADIVSSVNLPKVYEDQYLRPDAVQAIKGDALAHQVATQDAPTFLSGIPSTKASKDAANTLLQQRADAVKQALASVAALTDKNGAPLIQVPTAPARQAVEDLKGLAGTPDEAAAMDAAMQKAAGQTTSAPASWRNLNTLTSGAQQTSKFGNVPVTTGPVGNDERQTLLAAIEKAANGGKPTSQLAPDAASIPPLQAALTQSHVPINTAMDAIAAARARTSFGGPSNQLSPAERAFKAYAGGLRGTIGPELAAGNPEAQRLLSEYNAALAAQSQQIPITDALNAAYTRASGQPRLGGLGEASSVGRGDLAKTGLFAAVARPSIIGGMGRILMGASPFLANPQANSAALRALALSLSQPTQP